MAAHHEGAATLSPPGGIDVPSPEWTHLSGAISYLR